MTCVMQRMMRHKETRMTTRVIRNGRRLTGARDDITQCMESDKALLLIITHV